MRPRKPDGPGGAILARAGDDHLADARVRGALHDRVTVGVEAVVGEIDADVDEFRRSLVGHAGADHNDVPKPATNYAGPCRRTGAAFVYHSGGMTDDRCPVGGNSITLCACFETRHQNAWLMYRGFRDL
jgi:hypothetical protein